MDENNNLVVSISYQEIDEVLASNVSIDDYDYDREYGYDSWYDADYSWYTTLHATVTSIDVSTGQTQTQTFSADVSEYTDFPATISFSDYYNSQTERFDKVKLKCVLPKWLEQRSGQIGFVLHLYHNLPDPHLSYSFNLSIVTLQNELSLTLPYKTTYHYGEALDYTGCTATASYSHGNTEDITSSASFSPAEGTQVTSSRTVWVYYIKSRDEYADSIFQINVITLSGIEVTPPAKTSYHAGEAIDYSGTTVTARYSDGSTEDITSLVVFSPTAGTEITDTVTVSISYTNTWSETATGNLSLSIVTDSD